MSLELKADSPLTVLPLTPLDDPQLPPGLDAILAPLFFGTTVAVLLTGVLGGQIYRYFCVNTSRSRTDVIYVVLCALFSMVSWCTNLLWPTSVFVTKYGQPINAMRFINTGTVSMFLTQALVGLVCQAFFARKGYLLWDRNLYIAIPLVIGVLFSFGSGLAMFAACAELYGRKALLYSEKLISIANYHYISTAVTDVLISLSIIVPLLRAKRTLTDFSTTGALIIRLVSASLSTAAITSALAIAIAVVARSGNQSIVVTAVAMTLVQPRLYAISLMYCLNSREDMGSPASSSHQASGGRFRSTRSSPAEGTDSRLDSGVTVRLETIRQVDVEKASLSSAKYAPY